MKLYTKSIDTVSTSPSPEATLCTMPQPLSHWHVDYAKPDTDYGVIRDIITNRYATTPYAPNYWNISMYW